MNTRDVVFIDGVRTPFLRSQSDFKTFTAYDLGRFALGGLVSKLMLEGDQIGHLFFGNVMQDVNTHNIAREAGLAAGIPGSVPASTISMACISSNMAITSAVEAIRCGRIESAIAGGVEVLSDLPIRYRKPLRQKLVETRKYRKPTDWLSFFKGLKFSDLLPEVPSISEFSTGDTMGVSCDKMAAKYGVTRQEQDAYALRSHLSAFKAAAEGMFEEEVIPVYLQETGEVISEDNGVRSDSTMETLATLKPAFIRPHGTLTAGNSSFLTDGASASLIMNKKFALDNGFKPKAHIRSYSYTARKPDDELLIGPAFAIPKVLDELGITLDDIDVFEFHEAFAGQVLTVLKVLADNTFAIERLNRKSAVGTVPIQKLNTLGGSLSLGHPFGATGVRLLTTAANRLKWENGRYALIAACAAGGQGHAMIIERYTEDSPKRESEEAENEKALKDGGVLKVTAVKGANPVEKAGPAKTRDSHENESQNGDTEDKKRAKDIKNVKGQGGGTI